MGLPFMEAGSCVLTSLGIWTVPPSRESGCMWLIEVQKGKGHSSWGGEGVMGK